MSKRRTGPVKAVATAKAAPVRPRGKTARRHDERHSAPSAAPTRITSLDALRGIAIVTMIVYHFAFDLRYFGAIHADLEHDPRWIAARSVILSAFLLIAGISAVLAQRRSSSTSPWLRHLAVIAAAALLVSAASWLMFPGSFIWFGVLHAIAVSLLLAKPLLARPLLAAVIGVAVIASSLAVVSPIFDSRALGWIGFMTSKPVTEDYVPLFPWTGVLLLGVAAAHPLISMRFATIASLARAPASLGCSVGTACSSIWSISRYCSARSGWSPEARARVGARHRRAAELPRVQRMSCADGVVYALTRRSA